MAQFGNDTFTDTAGTTLTAHTADDAGTWTEHASEALGEQVVTDANRIRSNLSDPVTLYHSGAPATAEYDVSADLFAADTATTNNNGVVGRMDTAAVTFYSAAYRKAVNAWELRKLVSGANTLLGSYAVALTASQTYALKLEVRDAAKKVYIDGVERISSADNAITAAGKAGVRGGGAVTNTTGYHLDNFSADDPASSGRKRLIGGNLINRSILVGGRLVA